MLRRMRRGFVVLLVLVVGLLGVAEAKTKAKGKAKPASAPSGPQGTQDEARQLLEELGKPKTDFVGLSKRLRPSPADLSAIFVGEAVAKAASEYDKAWQSGKAVIDHAPDQTDLKLFSATIAELANGQGDAKEFPAGYKKAMALFKPGLTIYAWRFVRPGERVGMAYDGLVFVNGHFVWVPKAWRFV